MARPPRLTGDLPKVRADWQWSGEWWVNTDAVLTGAWRIPAEKRLLLLFANVSDQVVAGTLPLDLRAYGLGTKPMLRAVSRDGRACEQESPVSSAFNEAITFPPQSVLAWELQPQR